MFKLVPYTRSNEFELEIYKYLVDRKIILIDPESDLESFSFNEKTIRLHMTLLKFLI